MIPANTTTAIARVLARDAEAALDWNRAAALYDYAADVYPQPYIKAGALAERDVATLRQNARNCRAMVQS